MNIYLGTILLTFEAYKLAPACCFNVDELKYYYFICISALGATG